jgi:autotransporter-associated beta strand protein
MNTTFAASDAVSFSAQVVEDVIFGKMVLSAAEGFEFTGDGMVSVSTGLVVEAVSESKPIYSFKSPLQLGNQQYITEGYFPLSVAQGTTLRLEGGTESPVNIRKTGTGVLDISGSNVWSGAFIVADGNVKISGTITTPDGVDENTSVSRNGAGVLTFNMSTDRGASANRTLSVSNAVIEKPIWFAMGESASTSYFNFPAGTTNIFRGYFCNDNQSNQRFRLIGRDTVVALEGGGYFPWNFQFTGLGTTYIRNKPIIHSGGSNGFVVQGNENGTPTAVFEVAGNSLKHLGTRGEGGTIDMRVDNVVNSSCTLTMSGAQERTRQGSILLLNGTSQTVGALNANASVNAYSRIEGNGATLSIVNNSASSASSCRFRFVGDVSLNFNSPGTMMLTNAVSSSCGRLGVERGTVTLAYDAAWTNVGEVAVSGTGKLKVDAKEGARTQPVFGKDATLVLADDGVLDIADGLSVRVKHLFVNGVKMPRGIYSWSRVSDENVRKHFVEGSTGVVSVRGEGSFTVTVR